MKVRDLSGKYHSWNLTKYGNNKRLNASQLHTDATNFLRVIYPALQILEEVYIPGENLYLDIYIPSMKTAIECQGEQHHEYNKFFHNNDPKNFSRSQTRDDRKKQWCSINNIRIVYFYHGEDEEQWKAKM